VSQLLVAFALLALVEREPEALGTPGSQSPSAAPHRGHVPRRSGELLRAQQRLGHRDASTTLRNYAHALPLEDQSVADDIDEMLRTEIQP
jgi:integrase